MKRLQAVLVVLAVALAPCAARAGEPTTSWQKAQEAFAAAIEKGHKSTVAIEVKGKWKKPPKPEHPPGPMNPDASNPNYNSRPKGVSSGVLVDAEGHILTSFFNVDALEIKSITVFFPDGQKAGAKLLGRDETKDIALLKVDPQGLQLSPIEWAKEEPRVGSFVMALGRAPEPTRGTATRGIVSAWDRIDLVNNGILEHCIQFDAKTNYGNSGGPLVDLHGRLVGVVAQVRLQSPWGQNSGISFATPNYKIKEVLDRMKKGDVIPRPKLPFLGVAPLEAGGTESDGVLLGTIQPGHPAEKAGLKVGDVITRVDKEKVNNWQEFRGYLMKRKPGDEVTLEVRRGDEKLTVKVVLGERPN